VRYLLLLALLASGCAQDYGGITDVNANLETGAFDYRSGKEAGALAMTYERTPDGAVTVSVTAGDVAAFEGQAIQADRIEAQTEAITGAIRDVLPDILRAALCAAGLVTSC